MSHEFFIMYGNILEPGNVPISFLVSVTLFYLAIRLEVSGGPGGGIFGEQRVDAWQGECGRQRRAEVLDRQLSPETLNQLGLEPLTAVDLFLTVEQARQRDNNSVKA